MPGTPLSDVFDYVSRDSNAIALPWEQHSMVVQHCRVCHCRQQDAPLSASRAMHIAASSKQMTPAAHSAGSCSKRAGHRQTHACGWGENLPTSRGCSASPTPQVVLARSRWPSSCPCATQMSQTSLTPSAFPCLPWRCLSRSQRMQAGRSASTTGTSPPPAQVRGTVLEAPGRQRSLSTDREKERGREREREHHSNTLAAKWQSA